MRFYTHPYTYQNIQEHFYNFYRKLFHSMLRVWTCMCTWMNSKDVYKHEDMSIFDIYVPHSIEDILTNHISNAHCTHHQLEDIKVQQIKLEIYIIIVWV